MTKPKISIPLIALMMSFLALSIDAVLPALGIIGDYFNVTNPNDNQQLITAMFLGFALGQFIYGPISDSIGRKPTIYIGFVFFFIGSLLCIYTNNLSVMIFGRILQGFGLSSNRIVCMAIIRDVYEGNQMAKIMSFIMTIFIIVPTLAPSLGQLLLYFGTWKIIFISILVLTTLVTFLFHVKQIETLVPEKRQPFSLSKIKNAMVMILKNRQALYYTIISGFVLGSFLTYINLSQQIFQVQYLKVKTFPYFFAAIAISLGVASFLNGKFVERFGMFAIVKNAMIGVIGISSLSLIYLTTVGEPSFTLFLTFLIPLMFCVGLLFGNLNSIAMEPLGKIAGTGASVIGSLSTLISLPIAYYMGNLYTNSVHPLFLGFFIFSIISFLIILWLTKNIQNKV